MSMQRIAECLKWNKALDGSQPSERCFTVPEQNFKVRYQLWKSDSDCTELFELPSRNRARNGFMSRFML